MNEDTYIGTLTETLSLNRYIYAIDNPLTNKDPDGLAPIYIQNQNTNNNGREPYIIKQGNDQYFIRNGAEPVYSRNGDNYYITSGSIEVKEMSQPIISGVPSITSPGYQDDSPYAIDNVYKINNYIVNSNSNTRFIPHKENQIGNVTFIAGIGIGMNAGLLAGQVRHASEVDLLYNQEIRRVNNVQISVLDTGFSGNDDIIYKKRYDDYSILGFSKYNNELIWTFNREVYFGLGVGFSISVNLSEVMRRVANMFKGGCNND